MAHATVFAPWSNFYVITGSSAASLTGLMFVVMTIVGGTPTTTPRREGVDAFSTPTVVHLVAAFLVAAIASAPWPSAVNAAVILAIAGAIGVGYVCRVIVRLTIIRPAYQADLDEWIWYALLPLAAYAVLTASALLLGRVPEKALFTLAGSVLLLIFIGIHNAWDIVTYITVQQGERDSSDDEPR